MTLSFVPAGVLGDQVRIEKTKSKLTVHSDIQMSKR